MEQSFSGDVIVVAYWFRVHGIESRVIAFVEQQVHHSTITPPAVHTSLEKWSFVNGLVHHAQGIEARPPAVRRYNPLTSKGGIPIGGIRRYVLDDLPPEQVRLVWHNAERTLGAGYDWIGVGLAGLYAWQHRPDRIWTGRHSSFMCQELVCGVLRKSLIPMLADFKVGNPPMVVSPDSTSPGEGETWTALHFPRFEETEEWMTLL